ncbi:MAG TPA: transposase [Anaerolineae bacterium]|nr:transposase [Anaerolineae bacterium]
MAEETIRQDPLTGYVRHFDGLIGDKRTGETFAEIVRGIIDSGSLVCQRIAAQSSVLSTVKDGAQRVIRFATGESTKRSQVDAEHLVAALWQRGVAQLGESQADELWVIADQSDLRKPYASEMPDLMQVRDLDGTFVPGYRTLNVLGVTPGRRGILYHRLFSSEAQDFESEPLEVQRALKTVSDALQPLKESMAVSWIVDRGFDDVAVWRTIWEQGEHVVCRVKHTERLVTYQTLNGEWAKGNIEAATHHLRPMASARTEMVVRRGRQSKEKRQEVTVELQACPVQLTYNTQIRREGEGQEANKPLWLVQVYILRSPMEPWLLITDWPVEDADSAVRVFRMYRQRWAVEDSFKFTKEALGWEEVQLLDFEGIRTLVALAWVAAGFLYELGVTLEWEEVRLLARLGGWAERKDNRPGKIVLTRGLRRIADMLATQAFLEDYRKEHGALPPKIAAWLGETPPREL